MNKKRFSNLLIGFFMMTALIPLSGCGGTYRPLSEKGGILCINHIDGIDAQQVRRNLSDMAELVTTCPSDQRISISLQSERTVLDYNDLNISNLYRRAYSAKIYKGTQVKGVTYTSSYKDVGNNFFAQTMTERTNEDNNLKMLSQRIYQTLIMMD